MPMVVLVSNTPTANHRRPLPLTIRLCGQTFGQSLAKLLDHPFPQPLWEPFPSAAAVNHGPEEPRRRESRLRDSGRDSGFMNHE